jgi:flagellar motor switch protein FliN
MSMSAENYIRIWAEASSAVLSQVGGSSFTAETSTDLSAEQAAEISLLFNTGKALSGEQAFSMTKAHALRFAQMLLSENPDPNAAFTNDHVDALGELFRQIAGEVVVRWKSAAQNEIDLQFVAMEAPAWKPSSSISFKIKGAEPDLGLVIHLSSELERALSPAALSSFTNNVSAGEVAINGREVADRNLDLLMDVPLNVKLRFGRRKLPLREVLDLNDGAVVELDQDIDEPAELILGNKVIARGEVVIVDGNYGLRITEVATPQQRMASTGV